VTGPRPVEMGNNSYSMHSMDLATLAAFLQPGLQEAMLLVVDSLKMLEKTQFLAVSVPCATITKAIALQVLSI
jgi:hypothetical protein